MTQRKLEQLTPVECLELLKETTIGRIVFTTSGGPVAFPVNFGLVRDKVVIRIERQSSLRNALQNPIAFEVDHIDPDTNSGWSVLLRGIAREVSNDQVPDLVHQMKNTLPRPWAEGVHNVWVVIEPREVTGRKLTDSFSVAF